ncbi:MAG: alpha/beta hydrolase [Rhodospirillaceae bacterium]|nr:alpha/beta hydrolase [Rhodospirillaceae bacterium]
MSAAAPEGWQSRYFSAQDGLRLHYREYGARDARGVPVLCLSGLTRNARDFHDLASWLAPERRVICPDYRGRGRSAYDSDWHNYDPRVYLDDLRHLLAVARVHRAVFVGTSLGGLLTMGMAVLAPTAVTGAVLNDVGPELGTSGLSRIINYIGRDHPVAGWDEAVAALRRLMPGMAQQPDHVVRELARGTYREGDDGRLHVDWDTAIAKSLHPAGTGDRDLWPIFRALADRPVLALRGAQSDILSAPTFERMGGELPTIRRITVPEVGHAPTLAEPEVRAAIADLLRGVDGRSPAVRT